MKEQTVESSSQTILTLINEATAKGGLILSSAQALNFLIEKAKQVEILQNKINELEKKP